LPSPPLPIYELESALVAGLQQQPRVIIQAPTGSGKSTQVPQIVLDRGLAGAGEIVVLQPRRLATRMLAARVAQERAVRLGDEVGYQIRLDRVTSAKTRIRFVTEGVLLRQMLADPELRGVSVIIFDEFHERHLYGDITLARAVELQETARPDLRLIVMSATLDSDLLQRYLAPSEVLISRGRTFPVTTEYLARSAGDAPIWEIAAAEFDRLATESEGDVLIFMPGAYEISRTISALRQTRAARDCVVLPLHGELPPQEQDAAVTRMEQRKVIVSTNVAETSLTIEGVRVVIDSGLAKVARFDPYRGINTLFVERISRASAEQRAGRAGRTAPGHCVRLWTAREHEERIAQEMPEVRRLDLAEVVLTLKASGVSDVAAFRWLEPPEAKSLERAELLLADLGAVEGNRGDGEAQRETGTDSDHDSSSAPLRLRGSSITPLGRRMLAFPVHPRYARMLLAADEHGCVREAALVAALTQGRPILRRAEGREMEQRRDAQLGETQGSDFFLLMRAQQFAERARFELEPCRALGIHAGAAREAGALSAQFLRIARDEGLAAGSEREASSEAIARCILAGFPDHVAMRRDSGTLRCALVHGRRGVLARESVVHDASLLVAAEVREIEARNNERQVLLTLATAIEEEWLRELFPAAFVDAVEVAFESTLKRVVARRITRFHDLILRAKETDEVPRDAAAALLAEQVVAGKCEISHWDDAVDQWIFRLNFLAAQFPDWQLPPIGPEERRTLIEQLCFGAVSFREIKERAVWPTLESWLSPPQRQLIDDFAPARFELPNGRRAKIVYSATNAPTLSARIQDLYGVTGELRIAGDKVPLVIQVLAPNQRPIQVTSSLATFWKESYPKIKQELQRKYPKHEWR